MRRKWFYIIFILMLSATVSVLAQDNDVVPYSYVSRHLKDTIAIGNTEMSVRIWGEKDGLYFDLGSGRMKIDISPCVWDFNFRETLNYNDGTAIIENSYFRLKVFVQRDSRALWIKGKCQAPSSVAIVKAGDDWPYIIDSEGLDGDCKDFTVRISSGNIDLMNYKKAFNQNRLYWNEFWQRSYIKIEGKDSILTNRYNMQRWHNATAPKTGQDIRYSIKSCDWDIFRSQIIKNARTLSTLNLMMEYFSHSEDESFLHKVIVPMAQEVLIQDYTNDTNLFYEVCNRFLDIPPRIVIPKDLFETVSSAPMKYEKEIKEETIQDIILNDTFPRTWDVRYKLWTKGRKCIKGEFISGKWKRKPHDSHQDLFL